MRDITLADTVYIAFTTRAFATGIPTVLAGVPVISAYEDAGLTQITAGITLGVDHDSVVGFNMMTIVATGANGFEDNKDYNLVITTGTVGGVSVVGEVVGQFSIQRSPVNWANVSNPTTAVDLSATDIQLVDTASTVTGGATFAAQTTAQNDLDIITDADGVILGAAGVDLVWNEDIAGHLTAGTTGLSEALGSSALIDTTITGTPTSTTIQLTAGSTIDDFYNDQLIYILSGTGIGQVRAVLSYTGSSKTVTIDEVWVTTPAATDRVAILVSHVHPITQIQAGLATEAKQDTAATETGKIPKSDGTASWNATALAAINAEVVDTLATDTYAEPGQGAPAASTTVAA